MTTVTTLPAALNPQEHPMQHPVSAGATVRVTFDSPVHYTDGPHIVFANGMRIDQTLPGVDARVLASGYQPGDHAVEFNAGEVIRAMFRISPPEGPDFWISTDGTVVHDHQVQPTQLRVTPAVQPAADANAEAQA